jgi:hypothetical protein
MKGFFYLAVSAYAKNPSSNPHINPKILLCAARIEWPGIRKRRPRIKRILSAPACAGQEANPYTDSERSGLMKATIRERVAGARLRDAVPPAYRDDVGKNVNPDGVYTLILCAHNARDVIHSAPLIQAFRRLKSLAADGIIIVGTVFTDEAKAVAAEHGARIVALHKGRWTDESARQRQL